MSMDGHDEGKVPFSVLPEDCQNITAVYYQMDRLVASATLPQQYAFRLPNGGKMLICLPLGRDTGSPFTYTQISPVAIQTIETVIRGK